MSEQPLPHVVDATLKALDVLQSALEAETLQAAADAVRGDLEVLAPRELLRVATAVTVEATRNLQSAEDAAALLRRVQRARVEVMWEASPGGEVGS